MVILQVVGIRPPLDPHLRALFGAASAFSLYIDVFASPPKNPVLAGHILDPGYTLRDYELRPNPRRVSVPLMPVTY